jgi:phenylalanyl-tRNA synthetase beta chain
MKLTLNWLRDFVDLPTADPEEIREVLESLGHEVEEMTVLEPSFTGVVIGRVEEVSPHPNADQVRLCRVDIGGETSEIICGAWNFEAGAVVPVALPGAVLQGSFEIGKRKIRGIESNGMICSESELELGEDEEGIMVLNDAYPDAADRIGEDFASVLDLPDVYYEVSITPNRPDCMSVLGLARDLAAFYDVPLNVPTISITEIEPASAVVLEIEDVAACPRFAGREMRDVVVGPSPHWLRWRLQAAGVRPISNVVDASNYAMIEMGHPTHAFDLDRLGERVVVRRANDGEAITTLDEVERTLLPSDIVVTDGARPVAIAGVMGGADTEVHEGTTRLLIEAAYWEPPSIMLTSKRLSLRSEASARFERGMDPEFCQLGADRVAQLLEQIAGARAVAGAIDAYPGQVAARELSLSLSEVPRHLGIELSSEVVTGLLSRLGFEVSGTDPLLVVVPTRRPDVARSIDLIEEIARLHGFDSIPDRVATGNGGGLPPFEKNLRRLRSALVGAGMYEALTFSFIGAGDLDALGLPAEDPRREGIHVTNPLRDEEGVMRTTLLPGLLKAVAVNVARKTADVALFETGKVFLPGDGKIPEQPERLGFVAVGSRGGDWETAAREVDVRDATGLWALIAHELRLPDPEVRKAAVPGYHPGRGAELQPVGVAGELHPSVAAKFGLTGRVIAGEIEIDGILRDADPWEYQPPSQYPPVIFDLAFEVDDAVEAASLLAAIDESGGDLVEDRTIFDLFRGGPVAEGRKSIAVRLALRAPARTLTDEEVAPIRRAIVARVEEATGATLRGEA